MASRIAETIEPDSVDLFCARMVFQFPRWEDEGVDVDVMLRQIHRVLAPGGRLVIASHTFFPLQNYPSLANEHDSELLLTRLRAMADEAPGDVHEILAEDARRLGGLVEMVQYLGACRRDGRTRHAPGMDCGCRHSSTHSCEPATTSKRSKTWSRSPIPLATWQRFDTDEDEVHDSERRCSPSKRPASVAVTPSTGTSARGHCCDVGGDPQHVDVVTVPIVRVVATKRLA